MSNNTAKNLLIVAVIISAIFFFTAYRASIDQSISINNNYPHVDLPEEYELMSDETPIEGEYDPRTNTVTIKFKHDYGDNTN